MASLENPQGVVVSKWKDKQEVCMLLTKHGIGFVDMGKIDRQDHIIFKPEVIVEYNKAKMGIDVSNIIIWYRCT